MDNDIELFKGMKFSNLVEEIVDNSRSKRNQIDVLISDLRNFIKGPNDALTIVPLIRDYIDVGVKNDDQLVKLASVIQRIMNSKVDTSGESTGIGLTDEERKQLQDEIDKIKADDISLTEVNKKSSAAKSKLEETQK